MWMVSFSPHDCSGVEATLVLMLKKVVLSPPRFTGSERNIPQPERWPEPPPAGSRVPQGLAPSGVPPSFPTAQGALLREGQGDPGAHEEQFHRPTKGGTLRSFKKIPASVCKNRDTV